MKNIKQHILEKLNIRNALENGFNAEELFYFSDEDDYNNELYGEITHNNSFLCLYRHEIWHTSGGKRNSLLLICSDTVYDSITDNTKRDGMARPKEDLSKELAKIFDIHANDIYCQRISNYVDDIEGTSIEEYLQKPEWIDWLKYITKTYNINFWSYDINDWSN